MDPWEEWRRFIRAWERMLDELWRPWDEEFLPRPTRTRFSVSFREPFVDVNETKDEVIITAELPGVDKNDIEVNVSEDSVEIKAEQKQEIRKEGEEGVFVSRGMRRFYKLVSLPVPVDPDTAKASYKNGVLEIRIKKAKAPRGRRVEIE